MELVDRVSAPSRRMTESLLGINRSIQNMNGGRGSFMGGLNASIDRHNAALDAARGSMFDAVAAAYTLRAALAAPITSAMELETALSGIGSKAGLTGDQLKGVSDAAKAASAASNQYTADILKSVDHLVGMGMTVEDATKAIETIGKASTATGADILEMSQAGYAAIANLKVPADQVSMALDAMALAGKRGGFELKDMAQYFPQVGAAYQALGQTGTGAVADLAAAMQVMRADTGDASTAATNLQNVLQKIYAPGTVKKFADQGVDIFKEMEAAAARGLTPIEAIAEITNETLDGDLSRLGFLFEDAQAQAGVRSMIQGLEEFRDIRAEAMSGAGTNEADFNRAMQTTEQRVKKARIALANLSATIGSALLPVVTGLSEVLTPLIEAFGRFADQNPRLVAGIVSVTAAVIGLRVAMTALSYLGLMGRGGVLGAISIGANMLGATVGKLWGAARASIALQAALGAMSGGQALSVFGTLATGLRGAVFAVPGVSALASGIGAIGAALATISAPVWATFAAIAAAVAAAGLMIYRYWDRITAVFSGVGQAIGTALQPAFDWLGDKLSFLSPVVDAFGFAWGAVKSALSGIGNLVSGIGDALAFLFERETLSPEQAAQITERARQVTEGIINWFTGLPGRLLENLAPMIDAGKALIQSLWDGAVAKFGEFIEWVKGIPGRIVEAIGNIDLSNIIKLPSMHSWMGGGGGGAAPEGVTSDPMGAGVAGERAEGGPVSRGKTYLVGEEGPELITPTADGYVHTADETRRMMAERATVDVPAPQVNVADPAPIRAPAAAMPQPQPVTATLNLGGITIHAAQGMSTQDVAAAVKREIENLSREFFRGVYSDTGMRFV